MLVLLVVLNMSMRHGPRLMSGAFSPYMCCRLIVVVVVVVVVPGRAYRVQGAGGEGQHPERTQHVRSP